MNRPPNGDWHSADPLAARIRAEHRRNDRWALRLQIGVLALFLVAFPAHLLDRAAQGYTDCTTLHLPQCPDFLK